MHRIPPLLFFGPSIFDVLQHREQQLRENAAGMSAATIETATDEELVHDLTSRYKLEVPIFDEEKITQTNREVRVDVSGDPMRLIFDRSEPFYVSGVEITISVPFRGDPHFFNVRPSTFTTNPPRGEVRDHEVQFTYTRTDNNGAAVRNDFNQALQNVKQYLGWLSESVAQFNSNLGQRAQDAIAQRKVQIEEQANMIAGVGIPVKPVATSSIRIERPLTANALRKSIASPKKWDVFISHASEDKDAIARPLANALREAGLAVWYDEFTLTAGDSLRGSIDYGLANSQYGIVILSHAFFAKHWPVQELKDLAAREAAGRNLSRPIWHKVTAEDVREYSPMLADRVALDSNAGISVLVPAITKSFNED